MANEKPGGHGERSVAVGVINMAIWDAVAKIAEKPLYRLLAERYNGGRADDKVFVYAAGGYYYPGKNLVALQDEMRRYLDLGYSVVKIQIGGESLADNLRRIDAVIEITGSGSKLSVDANGRFDLPTAIEYAKAPAPYGLFWYEEADAPLDYALQAALAQQYEAPMATGENLFSMQDVRNLIRYGGLRSDRDWLQFDCALSYGLVECLHTLDMLKMNGWSARHCVPHGGHQMSLNIAAGLGLGGNESYPGVFHPFARLCRRHSGGKWICTHAGASRHQVRSKNRPLSPNAAGGRSAGVRQSQGGFHTVRLGSCHSLRYLLPEAEYPGRLQRLVPVSWQPRGFPIR